MFTHAIVRQPALSMIKGITTADLGIPDINLAQQQYKDYVDALRSCGLEIIQLESDEEYPDSVFVEDTAVLTADMAIITNPKPESRKGEIREIESLLRDIHPNLSKINSPGTIEGGDVLQVEDRFYIGMSERTNASGADQFTEILEENSYQGIKTPMENLLHLKTGVSYLGENTIVLYGSLVDEPLVDSFNKIVIQKDEAYAANCIRVNDYVLMPKGYPKAQSIIEKAGFLTILLGMSEFRKLDGGLSCLSLRF